MRKRPGEPAATPRHHSVSPDVFSAEALLMELNEPSGSGSGSHAEPSRLGAPVAHAPPDAARLPGAGRVEELEEDVQAVSTGQEIELRAERRCHSCSRTWRPRSTLHPAGTPAAHGYLLICGGALGWAERLRRSNEGARILRLRRSNVVQTAFKRGFRGTFGRLAPNVWL